MMRHFIAIGVLLLTTTSANACRPPYLEYSAVFEPGSATLSGAEVKRLARTSAVRAKVYAAGNCPATFMRSKRRSARILPLLFALSALAHAGDVPEAVIDSCLLYDKAVVPSILISPIEGDAQLIDEVTVPGYQLFTPASDRNGLRVGYATSMRGSNDYVFVGSRRGYVERAIAVGKWQPTRVVEPSLAAFAVLRQHGRRYVCVMESNGNGGAAFVRSAFVGRIPPSKKAILKLFYKVADVKKFKAFSEGPDYAKDIDLVATYQVGGVRRASRDDGNHRD